MNLETRDSGADAGPAPPFYAGVFLVSACILMLQVIETRILSLTSWYYLAFFIISMAMFGLTVGGVVVFLRPAAFTRDRAPRAIQRGTTAFAVSIVASLLVQFSLAEVFVPSVSSAVVYLLLALVLAVPYFFGGLVISLALTRSPFPVSRVYGIDLLGAGAGCVGALGLLHATDGPSAVLWVAVAAAVAAACFRVHAEGPTRGTLPAQSWTLVAVLAALALVNGMSDLRLRPLLVKGEVENRSRMDRIRWNSLSRVAISKPFSAAPMLWGASKPEASRIRVDQIYMNIDGDAGTTIFRYDGQDRSVAFLAYDVTNVAHALPGRSRAAIIGVGGGRDVLASRAFGKREIVGLEVNPIFVELLTDDPAVADFAGLEDLPGVRLIADEARSWLTRTDETFDFVQMSLVDTWAATGAGAFTLSENGLYTLEAWDTMLDRIEPGGILTVSRWYHPDHPYEVGRLLSLATASLMERGESDPAAHLWLAASAPQARIEGGSVATLVLKTTPFTSDELTLLTDSADAGGHAILLSPDRPIESTLLEGIVSARDRRSLDAFVEAQSLEFRVATDDWPFFFNHVRLDRPGEILRRIPMLGEHRPNRIFGGVILGNVLALLSLSVILVLSAALVTVAIVLPLRLTVEKVERSLAAWGTAYFLLIGVGFMLVEIALLQRASVFLGHPSYSLSLVLSTMVVSAGIGSLVSGILRLRTVGRAVAWASATGVYLLALPWLMPAMFGAFDAASLPVRAAVAMAVIAPAGVLMGFAFPTGMALVRRVDDRPTPWLWGINGAAGVLAGGMAVLMSMSFGIGATLMLAGVCYLLLVPALRALLRNVPA